MGGIWVVKNPASGKLLLPGNGLPRRQKRTKSCDAFKYQRSKAPVVHSDCVLLSLDKLWGLETQKICQAETVYNAIRKRCCVFTTYQVLKSPHKRHTEAAVVQLFGITKIYNLVNQLI